MMQGITDSAGRDEILAAAAQAVREQLDRGSAFDNPQQIAIDGFKRLNGTPPHTADQIAIAEAYVRSITPQQERYCFWLYHRKGMRPTAIAKDLKVDLDWVQRTIARHMFELRMRIYPE